MTTEPTIPLTDPKTFTLAQQRAAYDALGLDPAGFHDTMRIEITPTTVIVTRRDRDPDGRMYLVDGEVARTFALLELES